ncbi:hypothetical protein P3T36_001340 [Kitasatospora sp. MAP12-15]|uniref:hypothetical protein n=1 Tax=unclassified Kitasatospora TaxID=2633591 RepID=UPI00247511F2|nr:hypothetical protein [Kitasatospora sp. MAP12-44]MDH6112457.1 hypothetical protein [Kitasatospora sp. MAP12-44]
MLEMIADGGGPVATAAWYQAQAAKNATALTNEVGGTQVQAEVETLTVFKGKVDAMLQTLDGSDAAQPKISQQALTADYLGTGFGESTALLNAYTVVHTNLETLSQTLAAQIQAMSIAISVSASGYKNVEESQQETLWRIRNQTDAQYNTPVSPLGYVAAPGGGPGTTADGSTTTATTTTTTAPVTVTGTGDGPPSPGPTQNSTY